MLSWNGARPSRRGWQVHPLCAMSAAAMPPTMSVASSLLFSAFPLRPKEEEDAQGTLTLWFHENKDKDGNDSDKVCGVSCCHVLRKDTPVEYEHRGGAPKDHVRVCG